MACSLATEVDRSTLCSASTLTRAELLPPYPQFGSSTELTRNDGRSRYNSLQVSFEMRRKKGLNILAWYSRNSPVRIGG